MASLGGRGVVFFKACVFGGEEEPAFLVVRGWFLGQVFLGWELFD